jgi:hypothetical protein
MHFGPDDMTSAASFRRLLLLIVLYTLPLLQAVNAVTDPDIWWHLRTGEWILQHRDIPTNDPFTTHGATTSWVNYSWLFDVVMWGLYRVFGLLGIVLFTVLCSLLIAFALHRLIHRFALPFAAEIFVVALALSAMAPLFKPRPWLFTILFFVTELDLLIALRRSEGAKLSPWLLPPIFFIWANVHIQFSYGLLLLGLALLEGLVFTFMPRATNEDRRQQVPFSPLLWVLPACIAATLLNPYHFKLYRTL